MEDLRWDDPNRLPISNGPIRTVTAPLAPKFAMDSDGQDIEFLVPFPMHIIDSGRWTPLEVQWDGILARIYRPFTVTTSYEPQGRVGSENPDAFCTIARIRIPSGQKMDTNKAWTLVEAVLKWIRIKCRHYWILHGTIGYGTLYRSSIVTRHGKQLSLKNISIYGPCVVVRPLSESIWLTIGEELQKGQEIPLAESLYCDALLSIVAGDQMKALVEAGVAAEVALTQLLLEACDIQPDSPDKSEFRRPKGDRRPFEKKLRNWPQRLGLLGVDQFNISGMPPDWITTVESLYELRNGVAHAGKLKSTITAQEITGSLFAVNTLLEYCRQERAKLGLRNYAMPGGISPFSQTMMYRDGFISTESGTCNVTLA